MTTCPKCGGELWDNRAKKHRGEMKVTGPDFACKDKESCGWLQWPEKPKPAPKAADPGLPVERGPKWTWPALAQTYQQAMLVARKSVVGMGAALKMDVTMDNLLQATATIFIEACRSGVKLEVPKPEPEEAEV